MHKSQKKKRKHGNKNHGNQQKQSASSQNKENEIKEPQQTDDKNIQVKKEDYTDDVPYSVEKSDILGRYLVASRDIKPGEIIIISEPLVIGPCAGCDIICLGCYHPISGLPNKCKDCSWPICNNQCPGLHQSWGHSIEECSNFKKYTKLDYSNLNFIKDLYHTVVPLRCLLLKSSNPKKWEILHEMVAHNDIRMKRVELWKNNQTLIVDKIRNFWNMKHYDEDEIHTICGILEVNAFEVGQYGASVRGLFPKAYLLAHDCTPNTTHTDDVQRRLVVRAATKIKKGDNITLSYAYTLQGTFKRREHLRESKFFECYCDRCKDPTEFGTYSSALICPKCSFNNQKDAMIKQAILKDNFVDQGSSSGIVLSTDPLDDDAPWKCGTCPSYTISASSVRVLIQRIYDEHDKIDINDLEGFEAFLNKYQSILHPNHFLCLSAKYSLSQLYGKVDDYLIHEMSLSQLQRKRDICRNVLKIFDALEPGHSRVRGTTMYELHAPLMILTTRDFEKKQLGKNDLRIRLKEVAKLLDESLKILSYEPIDSPEGIMAVAAKDALSRIKDWEQIIGKI